MKSINALLHKLFYKQKGWILEEVVVVTALCSILGIALTMAVIRFAATFQSLATQIQLQEAGHYIMTNLNHDWGYLATSVDITDEQRIVCTTIYGRRKLVHKLELGKLYRVTRTGNGTGTNPIFLEGYTLENWQVLKASERSILVQFDLCKDSYRNSFRQLIFCVNGEVTGDRWASEASL